jgi:membrane protease YdiL (CAAX protease family)
MGADDTPPPDPADRRAWLAAAAVITFAYGRLAADLYYLTYPGLPPAWQAAVGKPDWYCGCELVFGLALALPTWRASGLRVGAIRRHWRGVLVVCGSAVAAAAAVYPFTSRPFAGGPVGGWLLSPPAQELVFTGFLYGRFERLYPAYVHPRLPVRRAVVVTAVFFAASHLWNFGTMAPGYVAFQLAYTFAGAVWVGLARQWTGSILPGVATHMAVNFIASRPV